MKVVVVDTYYPQFLVDHYRDGNRARLDYATQRRDLLAASFGTSDAYSRNLAQVGVEAEDIIANCGPLQLAWAREHGHPLGLLPERVAASPLTSRVLAVAGAWPSIVVAQIRAMRPDVLYLQDLHLLSPAALAAIRPFVRLIVGQCGSAPPAKEKLAPLDLILTSFPHYVERFRAMGLRARYFRIGFDPAVLPFLGTQPKLHACTFVGGISPAHQNNLAFLEHVARHAEVDFYGYGAETLPASSPILRRHHGEVWGLPMYRALAAGHITLNRHGAIAEDFANNMRLFEATGVGTLLLTDAKSNLHELFAVGTEVLEYRSPEECVELIRHYTARPAEAAAIAAAGQARTLREHSYEQRMVELSEILEKALAT